jgi:PP-loop superfamily ATP-utilizing enzyme
MTAIVSYGGGVQSTALLVLAAEGKIEADAFLFANVGDDSEHPATLDYVREVAMPFADEYGIALHELHRVKRNGERETLWGRLMREDSRSLPIPVRMPDTGAPGTRSCTADFKIRVIARWLREHGATKTNPATVMLGISTDEIQRAKPGIDPRAPLQRRVYPLLDLGMDRADCEAAIRRAGLPVPPKSACFFCPFTKPARFQQMRHEEPDLYERAVELERTLNLRRDRLGKNRVFLTRFGRPLDEVTSPDQQLSLALGTGDCESGWCMT